MIRRMKIIRDDSKRKITMAMIMIIENNIINSDDKSNDNDECIVLAVVMFTIMVMIATQTII